jgi:hypothetical protein
VLKSLSELERQPGAETLRAMAATLLGAAGMASRHLPDVLADASLVLYMTARPLLDGVYCIKVRRSGTPLNPSLDPSSNPPLFASGSHEGSRASISLPHS